MTETTTKASRFRFRFEEPANGRIGKIAVLVYDQDNKVQHQDRANPTSAAERRKIAKEAGNKLGVNADVVLAQLERDWNAVIEERQRMREQAAAGSAEAVAHIETEILDAPPFAIRRPLCLVNGRAYAAAWLHARRTERPPADTANGAAPPPPIVTEAPLLVIVRDDGALFTAAPEGLKGARSLYELGLTVHLPAPPAPGRGWSGEGVKRFLARERPSPVDVFERVCSVVNGYIDFNRSLAPQETMCELVGCYVLASYLLDAFHVAGYLWSNGERGTGKTNLLLVVTELGYLGQMILAGSSYPTLRDLCDYGAILGFDDAEAVSDVKRTDPDKRALLLAGNRKGATIALKELAGEQWVTRHINTYCPRLFSAIRPPEEVLASRSIVIPLVRSLDGSRAKANVCDHAKWPCNYRTLIDDLWALGLAHLPELPAYDEDAARRAKLLGRDLEPWRNILAVALWLDERHGVKGLHKRMAELSVAYQKEREDYEAGDHVRILFRALLSLIASRSGERTEFTPKELADEMNKLATNENLTDGERPFTTARRVGWALAKQRFKRGQRDAKGRKWEIAADEIESLAKAYGVSELPEQVGEDPFPD